MAQSLGSLKHTPEPRQRDEGDVQSVEEMRASSTDDHHEKTESSEQDIEVQAVSSEENEAWNNPKQNIFRLISINYGFIVFGMTDSSIGVLIPALERYYGINYLVASVAFLSPFCGYITSALASDWIHRRLGRWGASVLGTCLQLCCYIICICAPPFPVFVVAYGIAGLGNGIIEAGWNAWASNLKSSHRIMGFLHAFYGLGGIMCPSIFTAIMDSGRQWNICYSVLIGMSCVSITLTTAGWWGDNAAMYREKMDEHKGEGENQASIKVALKNKFVWCLAFILFLYVGAEVGLGGWITTFMIEVRHGSYQKMGYVTTGFWTGLTMGRVTLGFVTEYFGHEEITLAVYLACAVGLMLVFWLVKVLVVTAVAAALVGFFIGPAYPIIMVVAVRKLPKWLHISGVGFSAALGGVGAAILPFVNGIISETVGPKVLGPYAFGLLAAMLVSWIGVTLAF